MTARSKKYVVTQNAQVFVKGASGMLEYPVGIIVATAGKVLSGVKEIMEGPVVLSPAPYLKITESYFDKALLGKYIPMQYVREYSPTEQETSRLDGDIPPSTKTEKCLPFAGLILMLTGTFFIGFVFGSRGNKA